MARSVIQPGDHSEETFIEILRTGGTGFLVSHGLDVKNLFAAASHDVHASLTKSLSRAEVVAPKLTFPANNLQLRDSKRLTPSSTSMS